VTSTQHTADHTSHQ